MLKFAEIFVAVAVVVGGMDWWMRFMGFLCQKDCKMFKNRIFDYKILRLLWLQCIIEHAEISSNARYSLFDNSNLL